MKTLIQICDLLVIGFSTAAAIYWLRSALVKVPEYERPNMSPTSKNANAFILIDQISAAMKSQARLSARGAITAAIAAGLTALSVALKALSGT